MKRRNGFTLIELLAVIVILAIIALIATPIVLNIISDTKENAGLRSADFYLDAVEYSIASGVLNNKSIKDGVYNILENGNVCLKYDINNNCIDTLKVEVKGEKPSSGTITITDGEISEITLELNDKTIVQSNDMNLIYLEYKIGQEVTFDPGDGERTWNVIDEDSTTVTLMLSENLGDLVEWYKYSNHNSFDNSYGPKDALEYLNSLTTGWNKVDPIKNYTYINNQDRTSKPYGYQKIEIKNGVTKLTHKDGQIITDVQGVSKARLLSIEEVFEIAQKTNTNLTEENLRAYITRNLSTISLKFGKLLKTVDEVIAFATQLEGSEWMQYESKYMQTYFTVLGMITQYNIETTYDILLPDYLHQNLYNDDNTSLPWGYWTLSSYADLSDGAWYVRCGGAVDLNSAYKENHDGVRPVITVSKSLSFQTVE